MFGLITKAHHEDVVKQLEARLADMKAERDRFWRRLTGEDQVPAPAPAVAPVEQAAQPPSEDEGEGGVQVGGDMFDYGEMRRGSIFAKRVSAINARKATKEGMKNAMTAMFEEAQGAGCERCRSRNFHGGDREKQ
jgi:hypothetical protein